MVIDKSSWKVVSAKRYNHLFLFFSESFVLGLLWGVLAVPDLEMLSSLRRLLCNKKGKWVNSCPSSLKKKKKITNDLFRTLNEYDQEPD